MEQPQRTRWALPIAAGSVLAVLVAIAVLRPESEDRQAAPAKAAPDPPAAAAPILAPPAPPLRRGDLVAAVARAASAYAAGEAYPSSDQAMVGRRFEVVIPFGCSGPNPATADPARWDFDLPKRTITLTAQPQIWTDTPWVRALLGDAAYDRVDGFWIPRPWMEGERCPEPRTAPPGAPPAAPSEPGVGLVRLFDAEASRAGRRDARPYEVVRKAEEAELATTAHEYRLVLSGRISGFTRREPIRCHAASVDQRPACLIAVEIDRVAFVEPATGEVLAEWRD